MSRKSDFDWVENKEAVVIQPQDAIAVYTNPDSDIVIRRRQDWNEDDDVFIVIPRGQARRFIEAIERLLLPE